MSQLPMPDHIKQLWEEFNSQAKQRGYTLIDQQETAKKSEPIWYIKSKRNHNKIELKLIKSFGMKYIVGWGLSENQINDTLVPVLYERGVSIYKSNSSHVIVNLEDDVIAGFWKLCDVMEDIAGIEQRRTQERLGVGNDHSQTYLFIASVIELAVKMNQGWALNRDLLGFDKLDDLLTDGYSIEGRKQAQNGENAYREHVNPCINQTQMYVTAVKNGVPATDIAELIKTHNRILLISNQEAYKLDNTLGYRTTMPENWDGKDPYARITAAEIILEKFDK
jgi:hypothetical protein